VQKILVRLRWLAPPSCALAYSRPGRHTSTSVRDQGDKITYDYSVAAPLTNLGGRQEVQGKLEQGNEPRTEKPETKA
jgi:hypothetical protein